MILDAFFETILRQRWPAFGEDWDAFRAQVPEVYTDEVVRTWFDSLQGERRPTFSVLGRLPRLPHVLVAPGSEEVTSRYMGDFLQKDAQGRDQLGARCQEDVELRMYAASADQLRAMFIICRAILWLARDELIRESHIDALEYMGAGPLAPEEAFELEKRGGWGRVMRWEAGYTACVTQITAPSPALPLRVNTQAVLASLEEGNFVIDPEGEPGGVLPINEP